MSGLFTLTKPAGHPTSEKRQAGVEVTSKMIEAGREHLLCEEVEPYRDRDEVLIAIYRAMETARLLHPSGTT